MAGWLLSAREGDVLRLLVAGMPIASIARRLSISDSTTKTYVASVYEKLGAGNRAQAVMAAKRLGLAGDDGGDALVPARPDPTPPTLPPAAETPPGALPS